VSFFRPARAGSADQGRPDRLARALDASDHLIALVDATGGALFMNATARTALAVDPVSSDASRVERLFDAIGVSGPAFDRWVGDFDFDPNGAEGPQRYRLEVVAHRRDDGRVEHISVIGRHLERLESDPLTGLPNRSLLFERIERATEGLRGHGATHSVALLFVDIDHFKAVNERVGLERGDAILVEVARRLASVVRPGDTVARFGGDEFVVLCERLDHAADAVVIAHRIDLVLRPPIHVDDHELRVGVSIGISYADPEAADPSAMLRDADEAMIRARTGGGDNWAIFDEELRDSAARRQRIETALRSTRDGEELEVWYQPVVSLVSGRTTGVEALVRWRRDGVLVPPEDFVPVAESTGLVVPIGAWVLQTASRQVAEWQQIPGREDLRLAVNVSARQIQHPGFAAIVARVADGSSLRRDTLWLEITESLLLDDLAEAGERLAQLAGLGAHLALDDFGTGYSSLSYLRRLPVAAVKLDRSFVAGICSDPQDTAIVTAVIELARALGKECVAEGIEQREQFELLRSLGCDSGQGHLFSPPVEAARLEEMLRRDADA
jgi:diguanylate cyclase (GGDEF)-like protein